MSEPEPAESEPAPEPEDAEPKDVEPEWKRKVRLARVFEGRHAETGNDERLRSEVPPHHVG